MPQGRFLYLCLFFSTIPRFAIFLCARRRSRQNLRGRGRLGRRRHPITIRALRCAVSL